MDELNEALDGVRTIADGVHQRRAAITAAAQRLELARAACEPFDAQVAAARRTLEDAVRDRDTTADRAQRARFLARRDAKPTSPSPSVSWPPPGPRSPRPSTAEPARAERRLAAAELDRLGRITENTGSSTATTTTPVVPSTSNANSRPSTVGMSGPTALRSGPTSSVSCTRCSKRAGRRCSAPTPPPALPTLSSTRPPNDSSCPRRARCSEAPSTPWHRAVSEPGRCYSDGTYRIPYACPGDGILPASYGTPPRSASVMWESDRLPGLASCLIDTLRVLDPRSLVRTTLVPPTSVVLSDMIWHERTAPDTGRGTGGTRRRS